MSGIPFSFSLGLATRKRETVLRDSLQKFIDAKRPDLQKILEQFSVPMLPLTADSAKRGHNRSMTPTPRRWHSLASERIVPPHEPFVRRFGQPSRAGSERRYLPCCCF